MAAAADHRLGIRGRLAVLVVSGVSLALAVAGAFLVEREAARAHQEAQEQAGAILRALSLPCAMAIASGERERLDNYLAEEMVAPGMAISLQDLVLLDTSARTIARSGAGLYTVAEAGFGRDAVGSDRPLWRRSRHPQGRLVLEASMPVVSGIRWGTLVATFDLSRLEQELATTRRILVFVGAAIAAFLGLALMVGMARIVLAPLSTLSATVARIRRGDLSARAELRSRDELGDLAATLNDMTGKLRSYTAELEHEVQERTAELETVNAQLQVAVTEMETLALTDALTGLHNRRHFFDLLSFELRRSARAGHLMSLLMVDVDHFKQFNDAHGHQAGDDALRAVADTLRSQLRSIDIVGRYGGEEFVVLLLDLEPAGALVTAEKLRAAVAQQVVAGEHVTVSVGVAHFPEHGGDTDTLLGASDAALYAAKAAGRNCVMVAPPAATSA